MGFTAAICIVLTTLVGMVIGMTVALINEKAGSNLSKLYTSYTIMLMTVLVVLMSILFIEGNNSTNNNNNKNLMNEFNMDEFNKSIPNKIEKPYEVELLKD